MKLPILILLALPALAKDQKFAWDANVEPVSGYALWLYKVVMPEPADKVYEQKVSTTDPAVTQATITDLAPGDYESYATAFTLDDVIPVHSDPSNIVTFTIAPAPKNLRVVLQASPDMQTWTEVASYEEPEEGRKFFRAVFEP